jgi:hypothetical protein
LTRRRSFLLFGITAVKTVPIQTALRWQVLPTCTQKRTCYH